MFQLALNESIREASKLYDVPLTLRRHVHGIVVLVYNIDQNEEEYFNILLSTNGTNWLRYVPTDTVLSAVCNTVHGYLK